MQAGRIFFQVLNLPVKILQRVKVQNTTKILIRNLQFLILFTATVSVAICLPKLIRFVRAESIRQPWISKTSVWRNLIWILFFRPEIISESGHKHYGPSSNTSKLLIASQLA